MARSLKNIGAKNRWSDDSRTILKAASTLAITIRNANQHSLEQARDRLQEFNDAWLKTGKGDVLPCSGKTEAAADENGTLCDVDIFEPLVSTIDSLIADLENG